MPDQDAAAGTQAAHGAMTPDQGAAPGQGAADPGTREMAAEERAALEQSARGMAVRRQGLGDEHVDRATAAADAFTAPFQDLITRYAWGEVWTRPGLTRPERSIITLTALA